MSRYAYHAIVVMAVLLVVMLSMLTAPRLPQQFEWQQALDMEAFHRGLCPAYSEIHIHPDNTWTCEAK